CASLSCMMSPAAGSSVSGASVSCVASAASRGSSTRWRSSRRGSGSTSSASSRRTDAPAGDHGGAGQDGNGRPRRVARLHRKAPELPSPETAGEGPDAGDTAPAKQERRPGARRLVRSGAEEDDVAVAGDLVVTLVQLAGGEHDRSRYRGRLAVALQRGPEVDDDHAIGRRMQDGQELLGVDPGHFQLAPEAASLVELPDDVQR